MKKQIGYIQFLEIGDKKNIDVLLSYNKDILYIP